jgi:penicillin amidase
MSSAPLSDAILIDAMRRDEPLDDVARALGVAPAELVAARDAMLKRRARIGDQRIAAALRAPVEILRDRGGVPHIYGTTTEDVYFGLGFAMAQDRLWQMDRLRRRALGRQAEILGPAHLASDIAHRTVGIDLIAAREPALLDGRTHATLTAFCAGINRAIAAMGAELPIECALLGYTPEPFAVDDVVAIARGIWWSLNGRIDRLLAAECAELLPEALRTTFLTPEAAENLVLPDGGSLAAGSDGDTGSNNWAIAGAQTASGKPLLAGDPHQPFWVPSSWYEYALHGPEDDAAGAGHPGFPGLWWGSNGRVAWAITNNMASTRDLYRETVDPADPGRYRDGDVWRRFGTRAVEIAVRGAAPHALTIRSTTRGPIVNALLPGFAAAGDPPLALRWVGHEPLDDLRASIAVGRARDWTQFRAALRDWSVAVFNFVYADAEGNVGYQMAGRIPVRGRIKSGYRDALEPADRWAGHVPFAAMPHVYNPARGYVASANQRIVPADYPQPIYGAYSQGHRGIRIDQALGGVRDAARDATIALQHDVKNIRAERLCPRILALLAGTADADAALLAAGLAGWDHRMTCASIAPTLFETFMVHWQRRVLAEHIPARLIDVAMQQTGLCTVLLEEPSRAYFRDGSIRDHAIATAAASIAALRARLGADQTAWRWGALHLAHWRHPLSTGVVADAFDIGPAPVDGGSHTVCNTGGELPPHAASSGAEYRIVVDFAQPDSFLAVQNIGNSGVPGSPHYRDQFADWCRGAHRVVELRRERIDVASVVTLAPEG